jgi:hypothetical protein
MARVMAATAVAPDASAGVARVAMALPAVPVVTVVSADSCEAPEVLEVRVATPSRRAPAVVPVEREATRAGLPSRSRPMRGHLAA